MTSDNHITALVTANGREEHGAGKGAKRAQAEKQRRSRGSEREEERAQEEKRLRKNRAVEQIATL